MFEKKKGVSILYRNGIIIPWEHNILYQESKNMALETQELIEALRLNERTNDPLLADARSLAMRHLSSGAPIPMVLMDKLDRYERRVRK